LPFSEEAVEECRISGRRGAMGRGIAVTLAWVFFASTVFLAVSCQRAPEPIAEGEICHRCRRVITEDRLAGEILTPDVPLKYKAPLCMARFVVSTPLSQRARILVTDYPSGAMIDASRAWYVPIVVDARTNEAEYRAYRTRQLAEQAAGELGVGTVRWDSVLAHARYLQL
jgi:hypothetical protein